MTTGAAPPRAPIEPIPGSRTEPIFRRDAAALEKTQERLLQSYLAAAKQSAFVKEHGLDRVKTLRELRDAVPLGGYETHAPYIERMMRGEPRVLFDDPPATFLQTGGTSGKAKVLPHRELRNSELSAHFIDRGLATELVLRDHPALAQGKVLTFTASPPKKGEIPFGGGWIYAASYRRSPAFQKAQFLDPAWLTGLVRGSEPYVMSRLAVSADIRMVLGLPDHLVVFARTLKTDAHRLIRDVRDGTVSEDLSEDARAALPPLAPDPTRAAELEGILAREGHLAPRHLWPNLCVAQTLASGGLAQNRALIRESYGVPIREFGYSSTEGAGPLAFPGRDEEKDLVLGIHSAVFEFVDEAGEARFAHEVEVGRIYRCVLTTAHGLYRYDTHDFLEVTGHDLGGAPLVRFAGRHQTVNMIGEKITERQLAEAVTRATAELGAGPATYTFVPHDSLGDALPFYECVCEPGDAALDGPRFAAAVERALRDGNLLYDVRIREDAIAPVRVTVVDASWFDDLRGRLLARSGSPKVPVCLREHHPR